MSDDDSRSQCDRLNHFVLFDFQRQTSSLRLIRELTERLSYRSQRKRLNNKRAWIEMIETLRQVHKKSKKRSASIVDSERSRESQFS